MKQEQQQIAKDLYFQTDKTQQEIADILDVNRRTVYLWVKNGKWEEMKKAARQAPGLIVQDIFNHIEAVNSKVRNREDHCPTMQEVEMLRKLINMTKVMQKKNIGGYIESFIELIQYIIGKDHALALQVNKYADEYVKGNLLDKNFYHNDNFTDKDPERVRQTIANLKKMEDEAEAVILRSSKDIPSDSKQPQEMQLRSESGISSNQVNQGSDQCEANAILCDNDTNTKPISQNPENTIQEPLVILSKSEELPLEYPIENFSKNEILHKTLPLPTAPVILSHAEGASQKVPLISVHPDPVNNTLNITSSDKINTVRISNPHRQTVYTAAALCTGSLQVNVAAFPAGLYYVNINNATVREFIKP